MLITTSLVRPRGPQANAAVRGLINRDHGDSAPAAILADTGGAARRERSRRCRSARKAADALRINAASPSRGRERSDEPCSTSWRPQLLRGGLAAPHSIR